MSCPRFPCGCHRDDPAGQPGRRGNRPVLFTGSVFSKTVQPHEIHAVTGPDRSGKTTQLRCLNRIHTLAIVILNLARARRISDRTAFMLLGELVEANASPGFFHSPRDPRTARYRRGELG